MTTDLAKRADPAVFVHALRALESCIAMLTAQEARLTEPMRVLLARARETRGQIAVARSGVALAAADALAAEVALEALDDRDAALDQQLADAAAAAARRAAAAERAVAATERRVFTVVADIQRQGRREYTALNKKQRAEFLQLAAPVLDGLKKWEKIVLPEIMLFCAVAQQDWRDANGLFGVHAGETQPAQPAPPPVGSAAGLVAALLHGGFLVPRRNNGDSA